MGIRNRSMGVGNFPPGTKRWIPFNTDFPGYSGLVRFRQDMSDISDESAYTAKPMQIDTVKNIVCIPLSGEALNDKRVPFLNFGNYIPTGFGYCQQGSYLSPSNTSTFHVPTLLKRTNPSRPYVDTGTFIGELKDFPEMGRAIWKTAGRLYRHMPRHLTLRQRLDLAFKSAAKETITNADEHFIANQFGYVPFLNDVFKYADVGEVIEKRAKDLKHLQRAGSSSRKITLEELKSDSTQKVVVESHLILLNGNHKQSKNTRVWGSATWKMDAGSPLRTANSEQLFALSRKAVMGLTVDASTSWNLMPWSWLLDWASNAGDWIESNRNIVGARPTSSVCIMTRSSVANEIRTQIPPIHKSLTGGICQSLLLRRKREVISSGVLPEMGVQLLTGRQSAILGSLATLRAKKVRL